MEAELKDVWLCVAFLPHKKDWCVTVTAEGDGAQERAHNEAIIQRGYRRRAFVVRVRVPLPVFDSDDPVTVFADGRRSS